MSQQKPTTIRVLPFVSTEHPALHDARVAIARYLSRMPAAMVFAAAGLLETLSESGDGAHWRLSSDCALQHPERFTSRLTRPTGGAR